MRAHAAEQSVHNPDQAHDAAARLVRHGAAWALGGTALTVGAHALGEAGGPFVLAWGAIAFGLVDLVRGLALSSRARS